MKARLKIMSVDMVNHPPHYKAHPSGLEVIEITEHMNFCLGNVIKYVLRADHKGTAIQDLEKAKWYLDREIQRRSKELQRGSEVTSNDFFESIGDGFNTEIKTTESDFLECYRNT